jgi:hypothetical protein
MAEPITSFRDWLNMSADEKEQARAEGRAPATFASDPGPMPAVDPGAGSQGQSSDDAKARAKATQQRFRELGRVKDSSLSEEGDAQAFAAFHKDRVRYFHRSDSWAIADKDSGIWVPDAAEQIIRLTSELMLHLYTSAATESARNWAHAGHSRKRIHNTFALARSVPPISVPATDNSWDSYPFLLGVPNGVVDLTLGPENPDRLPQVRRAGELLEAYKQWCRVNDVAATLNHKTFVPEMRKHGFAVDETKPKAYTWLAGIRLLTSDSNPF